MRTTIPRALFLLLLICSAVQGSAEVYRWVDAKGKVHFSDKKPASEAAQTVDIEAPVVRAPDEGELRRRELLRRAEEDFAYKRRREAEDTAANDALMEEATASHTAQQNRCKDARIRLGVLAQEMPIYWTTDGQMRPAWANDMYRGKRTYIADDERPTLREGAQRDIYNHCTDPENIETQHLTYRYWEHQQWCQALRADIDFARQDRLRTPKEEIEALTKRHARDC